VNDNNVVLFIHQTNNILKYKRVYYNTGIVDPAARTISLKQKGHFDAAADFATDPCVSMNNSGMFMLVSGQTVSGLFMVTGSVDQSDLKLKVLKDRQKYDTGTQPRISLNNRNQFFETHKSENFPGSPLFGDSLYFHCGTLSDNGSYSFTQGPTKYDKGIRPSAALMDDGTILEAHISQGIKIPFMPDSAAYWYNTGRFDDRPAIREGQSLIATPLPEKATTAQVAAANGRMVTSIEIDRQIFSTRGPVITSASSDTWMTSAIDDLRKKPFYQITIPGSHDSGTYSMTFPIQSYYMQTQDLSIEQQLQRGCRYFDLRFTNNNGSFHIYHGVTISILTGDSLEQILRQIRQFMLDAQNSQELVVLNFSHFNNFDPEAHKEFISAIRKSLGDWICELNQDTADLMTSTYETILKNGRSTVAIIYDGSADSSREPYVSETQLPAGFFKTTKYSGHTSTPNLVPLFDEYSNKDKLAEMWQDQMDKLYANSVPCGQASIWYLFSWTLTMQGAIDPSIFALGQAANQALLDALSEIYLANGRIVPNHGPKINILYTDYFEYSGSVPSCYLLNQTG
jgi:hypothetical protein